ncbi:Usp domain-containing protein [Plectosphaerella cucumerina]|uniref:Usp domain-containing protein n=1 Tax=Plectosphaerella cucumerina TaxID=40658 RepID=A0A8K0TDA2_9PEZI|nr:Usp domain-containing protein [Plectosphaerella cucumerina]
MAELTHDSTRFRQHIAFDNLPLGEATKSNTPSLTLNVRHRGYQAKRRSRTFMVGVDEHAYSDYALQWLLDELVDDGDEVVCVRVIEKDTRGSYQDDAQRLMDSIIKKNGANRAISVILEYATGKLHSTFQKLIQIYQPAMLVVGTRGRSLGGLQGLVNTRNSFSKYCLQYSPIPVVVVRPTEKREKKKNKRMNDTERQTYVRMLSATGGKHEADSERSSMYEVEVQYSADEEAHQVAKVLGLPASFDPTIKPLNTSALFRPRMTDPSPLSTQTKQHDENPAEKHDGPASVAGDSDSSDSSEDEFEAITGEQALNQDQQERLHDMEVGEAAALLKQNRRPSVDSGDEEGKHSRKNSAS